MSEESHSGTESPESLSPFTPDLTLLDQVTSRLGREDQFNDLPAVRLLHSAVHTNEEIIAYLSKLESALQRPIFEYSPHPANPHDSH
jgi:hypothetical protein